MNENNPDPLRDRSGWMTPAEAAAELARKKSEPRRIWGAILLSGIASVVLAASVGSLESFFLFWFVSGMLLTSFVTSKEDGPGT